jgi:hypothetical protein
MKLRARRSRGARWILLALSLLLLTGHVCVLPTHGHAEPAATPADADHSRDGGAGDGAHGASCEALRSSSPGSPAVAPSAVTVGADVVAPCRRCVGCSDAPKAVASSPPLFLLHAALLI